MIHGGIQGHAAYCSPLPLTMRVGCIASLCVHDFEQGQCGSVGKGPREGKALLTPCFFFGSVSLSASSSFLHFPLSFLL